MPKNATKTSIESQIQQLDASVEWFYGDDFSLDQALQKYQEASKLAQAIEKDLSELKNQVTVIADFTKDE